MLQLTRAIAKNTSAQIIGRIAGSISTLILTVVLARTFGSQGYGEFISMTTFLSFFYLFADFGFNAIYIQRSEKNPHEWSTLLGIRLIASALLIMSAIALVWMLSLASPHGYSAQVRTGILFLVPTILFQALITTANGLFQKLLRYEYAAISVVAGAIATVLMIPLLQYAQSTSLFSLSVLPLLIGGSITVLSSLYFVQKTKLSLNFSALFVPAKPLFLATIPLGLTLIFNVIYFHIDSIVLTLYRPTVEVGIYGLAYKFFELTLVFPTFFMNSVYPALVGAGREVFKAIIRKSAIFLFFASIASMIVVWFGAPIVALIKPEFFASIFPMRILSLGLPLFFLSSLCMWVLIAKKKQWTLVSIYGSTMCLNIFLNLCFVPTYGYIAAAWITVICEGLVLVASGGAVLKGSYEL